MNELGLYINYSSEDPSSLVVKVLGSNPGGEGLRAEVGGCVPTPAEARTGLGELLSPQRDLQEGSSLGVSMGLLLGLRQPERNDGHVITIPAGDGRRVGTAGS